MKKILTLILLLIYSTALSQDIESHLRHIEAHVDSVRLLMNSEFIDTADVDPIPDPAPVPQPEPERPDSGGYLWHGLWDETEDFNQGFNTYKPMLIKQARDIQDAGHNAFITLSHRFDQEDENRFTDKEKRDWKGVLQNWRGIITDLDPERAIIFLHDEPHLHGFLVEEMNWLVTTAREVYGSKYQFGFSFTRGNVLREELPKQADFAILFMYVFHDRDYPGVQVWNKSEFDTYVDYIIQTAQSKLPNAAIFVNAQGFYSIDEKRWRKPPIEAPGWYLEAVYRNGAKGMFWWLRDSKGGWAGLDQMPDLREAVEGLNEKIPARQAVN